MKLSIVETRGLYFINKTNNNGEKSHCIWEYKWKTPHEYPQNYDDRLGYHSLELAEAAYKHLKEWYEKPKFVKLKEENIDECITLDVSNKLNNKNISMPLLPFVPEHLEYFKDGKQILVKLSNGDWDIVDYNDNVFQSIDRETVWYGDDIEFWAYLPKLNLMNREV